MSSEQVIAPYGRDGSQNITTRARSVEQVSRSFGVTPPRLPPLEPLPRTAGYDPRIAYLTSVISGWAYSDGVTMAKQLPYYGLAGCTVREFTVVNGAMLVVAAAYFVRSQDGAVGVLAFRGTVPDSFLNWLTDADTTLRNFHFGRVHGGFFLNVEPLWGEIAEAIDQAIRGESEPALGQEPQGKLRNLYITGHSLGAAMAVIAAARIYANDYADWQELVRGVYTYGQPAVGDADFARHYEPRLPLYRHVYGYDIVPHLPPRTVGEFVHFGEEFYATEAQRGWQCATPPRVKQAPYLLASTFAAGFDFVSRHITLLRRLKLPYSLEDHGPEGYIRTSRESLF